MVSKVGTCLYQSENENRSKIPEQNTKINFEKDGFSNRFMGIEPGTSSSIHHNVNRWTTEIVKSIDRGLSFTDYSSAMFKAVQL